MKKIRKKKKLLADTLVEEERLPALVRRLHGFIKESPQRAALLGMVILFVVIFVSVYVPYSYRRQNKAVRAVDTALASQTIETKLLLLRDVVDEYGGTPGAARALYYLGDGYYTNGQFDLAQQCYQEYLQKYPQSDFAPNAQEGLGYVAEAHGNLSEAIGHYRKLTEVYGDSYVAQHAWYNIGRCYEERNDGPNAIDAYEKQLSLYPNSAWSAQAEARFAEVRLRLPSAQEQQSPEEPPGADSPADVAGDMPD